MKKTLLALSLALAIGAGYGVSPAYADEGADLSLAASGDSELGTIETASVTGPVTWGNITYIPCSSSCTVTSSSAQLTPSGGGQSGGTFLGTVSTDAVTAPITYGDITYIP